jgi:hypothetical protein
VLILVPKGWECRCLKIVFSRSSGVRSRCPTWLEECHPITENYRMRSMWRLSVQCGLFVWADFQKAGRRKITSRRYRYERLRFGVRAADESLILVVRALNTMRHAAGSRIAKRNTRPARMELKTGPGIWQTGRGLVSVLACLPSCPRQSEKGVRLADL